MNHKDENRNRLISFLDAKAFDPILSRSEGEFADRYRPLFRDVKRSTENEKKKFHETCSTAKDIKENFISDLDSKTVKKTNARLSKLGLPQLPQFHDEFLDLCRKLGI